MTEGSAKGFWMSAALHGAVAAAIFFFGYVVKSEETEKPKIFELVAGEGDNYLATEAPALGTPGGVKMDLPKPPQPRPTPREPTPQEVAPPTPKATPAPPAEPTVPNFKKEIQSAVKKAKVEAKKEIAKERAAEKKRLEDEQKRMTKEEFDRANKAKAPTAGTKNEPVKVAKRIDTEGITKGVVGGSSTNKVGGAGGKALTALEGDEADRYGAALLQRLKEALDRTPGLADGLRAEAEFTITDEGRLTRARITKSSRDDAFDRAVLEAIASIRMGPRPRGVSALQVVPFSTHNRDRG
jgi:colicin import membrane protein